MLKAIKSTLLQAAKFELFFRAATLFIFFPLLGLFVQSYLEAVAGGLTFNAGVLRSFLTPRGVITFALAFLLTLLLVCFELGMLIHIARGRGAYPLRQTAKVTAHGMAALLHPTLPLAACYYVLFLPLVHVGYVSSLVPSVDIPHFVIGEMVKTSVGQAGAVLSALAYHALYLLTIFVPPYMAIERKPLHRAILESARLWRRLSPAERAQILLGVSLWAVAESLLRRILPLRILSNADFNVYFLKLLVRSAGFRLEVLQYLLLSTVQTALCTLFLMRLLALFARHEAPAEFTAGTRSEALVDHALTLSFRAAGSAARQLRRAWRFVRSRPFVRRHAFLLRAVLLIAVSFAAFQYLSEAPRLHRPWVIGHRGCIYEAENSLAAIRAAARSGAQYAEIDVQLSADGVPVLIHDANLLRLAGSLASVSELTAQQLTLTRISTFSGTAFIPTLEQAIQTAQSCGIGLLIELKTADGNASALVCAVESLVLQAGFAQEAIFMSLDYEAVRLLQEDHPEWWVGYCVISGMGDIDYAIWPYAIDFLAVEENMVNNRLLTQARARRLPVYVWTVDDIPAMQSDLTLGVSALITDDPVTARECVDAYWADNEEYTVLKDGDYPNPAPSASARTEGKGAGR